MREFFERLLMDKKDFEIGSGNVFADLGIPDPEEYLVKANLAIKINDIIQQKKFNQKDAAKLLGIDQPKISALNKGKLAGFSLERLFKFLNILGQEITIKIAPQSKTKKKSNVVVNLPRIKQQQENRANGRPAMMAKKKK